MPLLSNVLEEVWERILARMATDRDPIGLTTGIPELDTALGEGWNRQQLTYLVGDSGIGKSWLATWSILSGARWLAESGQRPLSGYVIHGGQDQRVQEMIQSKASKTPLIVFWSLEMAEMEVVLRMLAQATKLCTGEDVDTALLRLGKTGGMSVDAVTSATPILREWGKHIYLEFRDRSVDELRQTLAELAVDYDVCLIAIDYFRKLEEYDSDGSIAVAQETRSQQLSDLAKLYDTHVLCIIDVTRVGQVAKRIELSHIRGGAAAQFDADVILILNEHELSNKSDTHERVALLDLEIAKSRFGPNARFLVQIDRATGSFQIGKR